MWMGIISTRDLQLPRKAAEGSRRLHTCLPDSSLLRSREDVIYDRELGLRLPESVQFPQKRTQEPRWSPTNHCHPQTSFRLHKHKHTQCQDLPSVKRALPFSLACVKFPSSKEILQKSASLLPRSLTVASNSPLGGGGGLSCLPLQLNSCHKHYQERNVACSNSQMR